MSGALRPRKTAHISDILHRRLDTYSLVASAAGVSVLALAGGAEAKVVYTPTHQVTQAHVPLYIDLNHDGIMDFQLRTTFYAGSGSYRLGLSASGCNFNNLVAGRRSDQSGYFFSAASAVPAGVAIGPRNKFPVHHPLMAEELFDRGHPSSQYSDVGPWIGKGGGVKNRYLGLKFLVNGEVHYGWARISVNLAHHREDNDVSGTLTGYAYETIANKPIIAGSTEGADVSGPQSEALGSLAQGRK